MIREAKHYIRKDWNNRMLKDKKLAVLGAGKLGETLIKGLLEAGVTQPSAITVTAGHQKRLDQMREKYGLRGTLANDEAAAPPM